MKKRASTIVGRHRGVLCACLALPVASFAQVLKVSEPAWLELTPPERAEIQSRHTVEVRPVGSFGTVIDNQGVNESKAATSAGAALGGSVAEAAYIDRAIKSGNYSAKGQLGAALLGAMIGSAADNPAVQQFHFRYALQLSNGEIQYHDSIQRDAFRHPPGMCLGIPDLSPLPQGVCRDTAADLRAKHLAAAPAIATLPPAAAPAAPAAAPVAPGNTVLCKLPNLQPVSTTAHKCQSIGGIPQ